MSGGPVAGDGVAQALVRLLADRTAQDILRDNGFQVLSWHAEAVAGERAVAVDQTNESVVVGDRAVVKWNLRQPPAGGRRPAPGARPARDARRHRVHRHAPPLGSPDPHAAGGRRAPAARHRRAAPPRRDDGWDWAVDDVRALARGDLDLDEALAPAAALGDLVARMHLALATAGRDRLMPDEAHEWATTAARRPRRGARPRRRPRGRPAGRPRPADRRRPGPVARRSGHPDDRRARRPARRPGAAPPPAGRDEAATGAPAAYAVVDFDGNPVVAPADRARRRPAAVDVGGLLAALDHVGRVVVRRTEGVDAAVVERWIPLAEKEFLDAYRDVLATAGHPDLLDERLLRPVRLQQECREFLYAVRHLPHWRSARAAAGRRAGALAALALALALALAALAAPPLQ